MRLVIPLIVIGAILASQIALAVEPVDFALPLCSSRFLERKNERLVKRGRGPICISRRVRSSSQSSSMQSSVSSSSSSRTTPVSVPSIYDSGDITIRSQFLLLGEAGPVIAAVNIFLNDEALDTTAISVNLTSEVRSVFSFSVFDETSRYLGRAAFDPTSSTNRTYTLHLTPGSLSIPRRQDFKLYVRPHILAKDLGGLSDQTVQVSSVSVTGHGVWSSKKYTRASSETFQSFETSRSVITSVRNAGLQSSGLITGSRQKVASFEFSGRMTDASAHLDITSLTFQIEQTGGVSLANVELGSDGTSERSQCTVSSSLVTCSSIPDMLGSLTGGPRTLSLYSDVSVSSTDHASLRITLNEAGSLSSPGSITWSDGSSSFQWLPVDSPIASGTRFSY